MSNLILHTVFYSMAAIAVIPLLIVFKKLWIGDGIHPNAANEVARKTSDPSLK